MKLNCKGLLGSYQKIIIAYLFIFIVSNQNTFAKVTPPNYHFSLITLEKFQPGTLKSNIDKLYKNGETYEENLKYKIIKYKIKHIRYTFPIFVQFYQDKVVDYWAKLPSYFLHDIFLKSLVNKFGKQDQYFNKDSVSIYYWKDALGKRILYSGTCTITCFPLYLYMRKSGKLKYPGIKFLIDKFNLKNKN